MQKEVFDYVIVQISRDFEGVQISETSLPNFSEQHLMTYILGGTYAESLAAYRIIDSKGVFLTHTGTPDALQLLLLIQSLPAKIPVYALPSAVALLEAHHATFTSYHPSLQYYISYSNLDGLLFALLSGEPLIIIGDPERYYESVLNLLQLLPAELRYLSTFITHTETISDNFQITCIKYSKYVASTTTTEDIYTFISLTQQQIIAPKTCKLTQHLALALQNGAEQTYDALLQNILQLVNAHINVANLRNLLEASNLSVDDAELIFAIISRIQQLPQEVIK